MRATTEKMICYVGGQVEIVGTGSENYRYRGQISKIEVQGVDESANLHVEFEYICKWDEKSGYKPDENKPYDLSLCICGCNDIGNGRFCINSPILGEMSVFYPPTHNKRVLADGSFEHND